jgi:hypothetical protein
VDAGRESEVAGGWAEANCDGICDNPWATAKKILMHRSRLHIAFWLLPGICCWLLGCRSRIQADGDFQLYFTPKSVIVLRDDRESTTWHYLTVYNSDLTKKEFEYSSEKDRFLAIDTAVDDKIYVSLVRWDLFDSSNRTANEYSLLQAGKYDIYLRVLHLGGTENNDDTALDFQTRQGNRLLFKNTGTDSLCTINLKHVIFRGGRPYLAEVGGTTLRWSQIIFKDSANFAAFKRSLMIQ